MIIILKGIITGLIFFYIAYISKKEAEYGNLFFSKWLLWLGFISLTFSTGILYLLLSGQVKEELSEYIASALLIISFGGGGVASILE